MPELPEVETTRRGIAPHIVGQRVVDAKVRDARLRWPIAADFTVQLQDKTLRDISRRGKYLLLHFDALTVLWHLGMSGSLRIVDRDSPIKLHDHVDVRFANGKILRFHDPRRFGAVLCTQAPVAQHPLLVHLGPEPLSEAFHGDYLFQRSRKIKQAVKSWIMNNEVVVGVGNIYANEALFLAGIHPLTAAGKISQARHHNFAEHIRQVLHHAIQRGGTTLRDFVGGDGKPGYFAQELHVYGRGGEPCTRCGKALTEKHIAQRSTVYCTDCQKR